MFKTRICSQFGFKIHHKYKSSFSKNFTGKLEIQSQLSYAQNENKTLTYCKFIQIE